MINNSFLTNLAQKKEKRVFMSKKVVEYFENFNFLSI